MSVGHLPASAGQRQPCLSKHLVQPATTGCRALTNHMLRAVLRCAVVRTVILRLRCVLPCVCCSVSAAACVLLCVQHCLRNGNVEQWATNGVVKAAMRGAPYDKLVAAATVRVSPQAARQAASHIVCILLCCRLYVAGCKCVGASVMPHTVLHVAVCAAPCCTVAQPTLATVLPCTSVLYLCCTAVLPGAVPAGHVGGWCASCQDA